MITTTNKNQAVQEYWDTRPCNIRHSSAPYLSKQYFDEVEAKRYRVESHIPGFANFDAWKGKKVLEIGCGIGTDSIRFARAGAHLTVVDVSQKSLDICRERFSIYGETARFYHCDAEHLQTVVPIEAYDLIYSFGVIHHTSDPATVVKQLQAYTHAETQLRVMLYSKLSWKLFWLMMETNHTEIQDIDNVIRIHSEAQTNCPVTWTYTFEEAKALMAQGGFVVTEIWKDHIFVYDIEPYKNGEYVRDKYWRGVSDSLLRDFKRELGWHTLVIAVPEKTLALE